MGDRRTFLDEVRRQFRCPAHRRGLAWPDEHVDQWISCPEGCRFEIVSGIPRFVRPGHYATAFGVEWRTYRQTQLDSYTGHQVSRDRLARCLGGLDRVHRQLVLEVGAGAGRFTEILLAAGATLVSLDVSDAVEANRENCQAAGPYLLLQADINASPLPERAFDVVLCLGVIQHTPSPEATLEALARHVKPGGWLVLDHYALPSRLHALSERLSMKYPLRAVLRRVARRRPDLALRATRVLTAFCDPVRRRTARVGWLDDVVGRLLPTQCYYGVSSLPPAILYQWHELDTFDRLTDWFKHFRSREEIRAILESLGFAEITCEYGGNGVEARARVPVI